MIVNFNEEEAIITYDGLQIHISKDNEIYEYFADIEDDE